MQSCSFRSTYICTTRATLALTILTVICYYGLPLFKASVVGSPHLLKTDIDYTTHGTNAVIGLPDSEMLEEFSHLLPGFKKIDFSLEADSSIATDTIKKDSTKFTDGVTNSYQLSGITVETNYSRAKDISLASGTKPLNIKQLITLKNHTDHNKIITLKSRSQISAATVLWNGNEYQLTTTPISFKAFKKTAPVTIYAEDIGAKNIDGIEAFQNYSHSYFIGSSLSFAGDNGLATYDWKDVQAMDHEVFAYLEDGVPVIELVLYNLAVPAQTELVIDPEYSVDDATNYTARITGDAKISNLVQNGIITGDVNGDSHTDLLFIVSSSGYIAAGSSVFVIFGNGGITNGGAQIAIEEAYNIRFDSETLLSSLKIGDVNSDNLTDLIIAAEWANNGTDGSGSAWVIFSTLIDDVGMTTDNARSLQTASDYNIRYDGAAAYDSLTRDAAIDIGDVNGDGLGDLILGTYAASNNGASSGSAWVIFSTLIDDVAATTGNNHPLSNNLNYNIRYDGSASAALSRSKTITVGDINGDSLSDLVLGGSSASNNGAGSGSAWVIFSTLVDDVGATTGNNKSLSTATNYNLRYNGPAANMQLTSSGSMAISDLNGDGLGDLILGSQETDYNAKTNSGSVWIMFSTLIDNVGSTTGNNRNLNTAGNYNIRYDGAAAGDRCPSDGAIATGDINTDGFSDLALAAYQSSNNGASSGSAWVILSTLIDDVAATTGNNRVLSTATHYNIRYDGPAANSALTNNKNLKIGDVNGDNYGDLILAASTATNNGSQSGSAWLIFSTLIDDIGATTGNNKSLATSTNYNIRYDGEADDSIPSANSISIGDINADGKTDLLFGSNTSTDNRKVSGSTWLHLSTQIDDVGAGTGNNFTLDSSSNYSTRFDGSIPITAVSRDIAIGDVNGDTLPDLAIAASTSFNGLGSGSVYVLFGGQDLISDDKNLSISTNYNIRFDGAAAGDYVTVSEMIGDVNGDGLGDLILSSVGADNSFSNAGSVWVILSTLIDDVGTSTGNIRPLSTTTNFNIRYDGSGVDDALGFLASGFSYTDGIAIGDVNGNGTLDLVLGAYGASNNGASSGSAWIIFSELIDDIGETTGNIKPLATGANYNIRYDGGSAGDGLTSDGIFIGDVNGDSLSDLILATSVSSYNGAFSGSAWVIFSSLLDDDGFTTGNNRSLGGATNYNIRYDGEAGDFFAYGGIKIGDVNGDSISDLVLGGSFANNAGALSGSIWLVFSTLLDDVGATTGNNKLLSTPTNYNIRYDGTGASSRIGFGGSKVIGDLNGDSLSDLAFGSLANQAWVIYSTLIDDVGTSTGNIKSVSTGTNYNIRYETDNGGDQLTEGGAIMLGDVNGDGDTDLMLGSLYAESGVGYGAGAAWVLLSTLIDDNISTGNNYSLDNSNNYSFRYNGSLGTGYLVADMNVHDLNNSGRSTIFLSAIDADITGGDTGALHVIDIPFTMSGTVYTDKGLTDIGLNKTVAVSINGEAANTTSETNASGEYSMLVPGARQGDLITLYVNDESEKAVTVVAYDKTDESNLDLYQNFLIAQSLTDNPITNALLALADDSADADITSLYSVAASNLTTPNSKHLFIPNDTIYEPGGNITIGSNGTSSDLWVEGTLTLSAAETATIKGQVANSGTFTAANGAIDITNGLIQTAGSFTASATNNIIIGGVAISGGSFNHNDGAIVLNGGSQTVNIGAREINDLTINLDNNTDDLIITGTLSVLGSVTITQVDEINTGTLSLVGDITNSDDAINGTAVFEFTGPDTQSIDTSVDPAAFNLSIVVDKSAGQLNLSSHLLLDEAGQDLTIIDGILDLAGHNLEVADSFSVSGLGAIKLQGAESISTPTFASGASLTVYGASDATLPASISTYKNLTIDSSAGSPTFTLPNVDVTIAEGLSITGASLAFDNDKNLTVDDQGGAAKAISVAASAALTNSGIGDLILAGDVSNLGSVIFNSSADTQDAISISSSSAREWQGAGTYSFTDVSVSHQVANSTAPGLITTVSSTDNGNNTRWIFGPPDNCPGDPDKLEPGTCGCGVADSDTDDDGTLDCQEQCPNNPDKTEPGTCGCSVADSDTDDDGTLDCQEQCPSNPNKQTAGDCGCTWDRENEDIDEDNQADCELADDKLFSVSGKLFTTDDLNQKVPFFDDYFTHSATNPNINDIWVTGYRQNADGDLIAIGRAKVNRNPDAGSLSTFTFNNLPGSTIDADGKPVTRNVTVQHQGQTIAVQQAVGGYIFSTTSTDNYLEISPDYQLDAIAARQSLLGCAAADLGTEKWVAVEGQFVAKDPQCIFSPLFVGTDLAQIDQQVTGCIDDVTSSGVVQRDREIDSRRCWLTKDTTLNRNASYYLPEQISDLTATTGSRSDGVRLTWTAVANAAHYKIMRSQYPDENSSYDRRYDSAVESDADAVRLEGTGAKFYGEVIQPIYISNNFNSNTVSYLDTTAVAGVRYDYVVAAVHPVGSSSHSAAATGWRSISNSAALDSDGDGVRDVQEISEATDKFDPGSLRQTLHSPVYSKYNTFLEQQNWLELHSIGSENVYATISLFDHNGEAIGELLHITVPAQQQIDLDIHSLVGRSDSYGLVKIEYNDNNPNAALQGRMSFYRIRPGPLDLANSEQGHSFAFTRELRNTSRGLVYATANSIDPQGKDDPIFNWLELSNIANQASNFTVRVYNQSGTMVFDSNRAYDADGNRLSPIAILPKGEIDIQVGHQFGQGVYLVEVIPQNGNSNFHASLTRYGIKTLSDSRQDYSYAMSLDALRGTGDALYLPVEKFSGGCWTQSNWLEVVNTRQRNIAATATLRDSFGSVIEQTTLNLAPLEQQHLNVGLLFGDVTSGYIEIAENKRGALRVQNTTYFHDCSTNSLQSAYLSPGQLPGGQTQISSYNRFLQINNVLSVFNTTPTPLDYQLDLDPAAQLFSQSYTLPAKQLHRYQLNDETIFNTLTESYGPIEVTSQADSICATNFRVRTVGGAIDFVMPTALQ